MLGSNTAPADVLTAVDCVIVLPNVKKFGLGVDGSGGRAPMTCRKDQNFSGTWSAPAMRDQIVRNKLQTLPLRNLFAFIVWIASFFPQRIRWHDREFYVREKRLAEMLRGR